MAEAPRIHPGWDADMKALIRRVYELGPAKEGFDLSAAETVVAPERYHAALEAEIALGPAKARVMNGALKRELERYIAIRDQAKK
jgi:hypothetical protein